jgi:Ca2+-binding EF-hand superfamily protein
MIRLRLVPVALPVMLSLLAGCAGRPSFKPVIRYAPVSPSGELLGLPSPDKEAFSTALRGWFSRTDSNGDCSLSPAELLADTDRNFARFDSNGDGSVTSSELTAMRLASPFQLPPERPTSRPGPRSLTVTADQVELLDTSGRNQLRRDFDPVMAADSNADFRVSRDELRDRVRHRFTLYDRDRDGRLSVAEFISAQREALDSIRTD